MPGVWGGRPGPGAVLPELRPQTAGERGRGGRSSSAASSEQPPIQGTEPTFAYRGGWRYALRWVVAVLVVLIGVDGFVTARLVCGGFEGGGLFYGYIISTGVAVVFLLLFSIPVLLARRKRGATIRMAVLSYWTLGFSFVIFVMNA